MSALLLAATLALAVPAAQPTLAAPAAAAATPADPDRLAAARQVVQAIWPLGTYGRVMARSLDAVTDMMTGDLFGPSLDTGRAQDPHFDERMKLTLDTMTQEMSRIMARFEPDIRAGLAEAYAGRFDTAQLADLNRFFATPTGRVYAAESMLLMTDPALMKRMQAFLPEMMKAMPAILDKVKAATAHLPAPPAPTEGEAR